jgi:hypothetical protein
MCRVLVKDRPSPDRLSAGPYIYVRSTCTRVRALQSLSCCIEAMILFQDRSTKNRPVFGLGSSFGEPQLGFEGESQLIS